MWTIATNVCVYALYFRKLSYCMLNQRKTTKIVNTVKCKTIEKSVVNWLRKEGMKKKTFESCERTKFIDFVNLKIWKYVFIVCFGHFNSNFMMTLAKPRVWRKNTRAFYWQWFWKGCNFVWQMKDPDVFVKPKFCFVFTFPFRSFVYSFSNRRCRKPFTIHRHRLNQTSIQLVKIVAIMWIAQWIMREFSPAYIWHRSKICVHQMI